MTDLPVSGMANYADLFLRLLDGGVLVDCESLAIRDINDACEKLLGTSRDQILGSCLSNWVTDEQKADFEKTLRIARRRYHPREWQSQLKLLDGRVLDVRIVACMLKLNNDAEALQILIRDISEELASQRKIKEYIGELEVLNKKLEALSTTDEMTKLANFRYFKSQLQNEHARAQRYSGEYAIVFIDADHFKHYNDRNGHPAGDELLREIARIIKLSARDTDLPARYGGEEFVVLCPEVPWKNAMVLAERIREAIAKRTFPQGEHQPLGKVTVSVGVASYPVDGGTPEEILQAADQSVYFSKQNGRNRSTSYQTIKLKNPKSAA